MTVKSTKLKSSLLIGALCFAIGAVEPFLDQKGDSIEKIKKCLAEVEKLSSEIGKTLESDPTWVTVGISRDSVLNALKQLSYQNRRVAEAKALIWATYSNSTDYKNYQNLIYLSSKTGPNETRQLFDEELARVGIPRSTPSGSFEAGRGWSRDGEEKLGSTDRKTYPTKTNADPTSPWESPLWNTRYEIAAQSWNIADPIQTFTTASQQGAIGASGGFIATFIIISIVSFVWYFFLDRLREVAAALRKDSIQRAEQKER